MQAAQNQVDVLVIGGGTAGAIAAIQAARAGARTLVIETGSQLGGTMTSGGVNYPGLFHAWGKQVIAGIGWELVERSVQLDSGTMPDFTVIPERHSHHQVRVNGPLYAALAEEACLGAGVQLCYYEIPTAVQAIRDGFLVQTAGKGVVRRVSSRQLIDCTGGADVVAMLGHSRLRDDETQPATIMLAFGGYDAGSLDADEVQQRYEQALADGSLHEGDYCHAGSPFINFLRGGGGNAVHLFDLDSSTSIAHTQANIEGRRAALRLLRFIRSLPACEDARIVQLQPETAIRETFRIVGETRITVDDYTSGRVFEDAICNSFYPIDLHDRSGVTPEPLVEGTVPTIPLSALVPRGSRNLLVAGRSVSSDRLANSALRVQASCMAMGQAAGAAATLAARSDRSPVEVPIEEVRTLLREHGAIVP